MRRTIAVRVVAGAAVVMVAAAACGGGSSKSNNSSSNSSSSSSSGNGNGASAPGVTATSILIGSGQPLTGPAAPGYSEISPASKAYFDFVNASGGVNGRKITYKYLDDAYNPTQEVQVIRQLILQDKVFAVFNDLGTPTHLKSIDFINQNKVPDLFVASGCTCWDQPQKYPYTFGWQTDYVREGKVLGKYIADNFKGKKVAYFYQNDDFGQDGVKGLDMEIPKAMVATKQSYELGQTDISAQGSAIKSSGADVVAIFAIPAYTALLKGYGLKAGYSPQFVVSSVSSDPGTLTKLLKDQKLIEGIVSAGYLPPPTDTSDPWVKFFKGVHDKYATSLPWDANVEYGMAVAYTFVAAVEKAGKNLTRDGLVKAVEANSNLNGPGLVPYAFSDTSHAGFAGEQISIIKNGQLELQGKPFQTDKGSGPVNQISSSETQNPPQSGVPSS